MRSERLEYQPVAPENVDAFHTLVQDEHVRRYLMDGHVFPREWTEERMRDSESLFTRRGVGIWLAYDIVNVDLVGFCGFLELLSIHPEPQLVYAVFPRFVGKGYATEMVHTAIDEALTKPGFKEIIAGVDAVNTASVRILEKLGFKRISIFQGSFGKALLLKLENTIA